jgi:hypothetical protein
VTLALRNVFSLLGGSSATYTTRTVFGSGTPENIPINIPPEADDDLATTNSNASVAVDILSNDSDPDGTIDPTTVTIIGAASHGTTSVNPLTGVVTYTPSSNFFGNDSFTYTVEDNSGGASNVATVSITVNAFPVAVSDSATTNQNTAINIDVLANDSDQDGTIDPTTVTIIGAASHGTTSVNPITGVITYTPSLNYVGPDSLSYTVKDNSGADSNLATVTIDVTGGVRTLNVNITPDSINLASTGVVPFVIYTTSAFDASTVDASTVRLAGAEAIRYALEDADADGDLDLVMHFRRKDTALVDLYRAAILDDLADGRLDGTRKRVNVSVTGQTSGGQSFVGTDAVDVFFAGKALRDFLASL